MLLNFNVWKVDFYLFAFKMIFGHLHIYPITNVIKREIALHRVHTREARYICDTLYTNTYVYAIRNQYARSIYLLFQRARSLARSLTLLCRRYVEKYKRKSKNPSFDSGRFGMKSKRNYANWMSLFSCHMRETYVYFRVLAMMIYLHTRALRLVRVLHKEF